MAKLLKKIVHLIYDDGSHKTEVIPEPPVQSGSNLTRNKELAGLWT